MQNATAKLVHVRQSYHGRFILIHSVVLLSHMLTAFKYQIKYVVLFSSKN